MPEEEKVEIQVPTTENTDPGLLKTDTEQPLPDTSVAKEPEQVAQDQRPEWLPEKFKSAEDLAKSYGELEKKIATHVPKDYDYTFSKDLGLQEMPEDLTKEVTDTFKKGNFSQDQVKIAMSMYADQVEKLQQEWANAPRTDLAKEDTALKTQWGDDYVSRLQVVQKYANTLPKRVLQVPLVDSAEGIMFLEQLMESKKMPNPIASTGVPAGRDPVAIREEIQTMRGDPKMKLPPGDPVGDAHQQRMYALYETLDRLENKG